MLKLSSIHFLRLKIMSSIIIMVTKILMRRKRKEFGTNRKIIMFGRKIKKMWELKNKKVRRLI